MTRDDRFCYREEECLRPMPDRHAQPDAEARSSAIARIIQDARSARGAGRCVDDEAVAAANPELLPELARELAKLRRVGAARRAADRRASSEQGAKGQAYPPARVTDEALRSLEGIDPRAAAVVRRRVRDQESFPAIAASIGIPVSAVVGDWRFGRAWLYRFSKRPPCDPREPPRVCPPPSDEGKRSEMNHPPAAGPVCTGSPTSGDAGAMKAPEPPASTGSLDSVSPGDLQRRQPPNNLTAIITSWWHVSGPSSGPK